MTLKLKLSLDFLTMHLSTKFRHPRFNCSEVIAFAMWCSYVSPSNKWFLRCTRVCSLPRNSI